MYFLFAHHTVDGHLVSFQVWAVFSSATLNILEVVFGEYRYAFLLGVLLEVELLGLRAFSLALDTIITSS